MWRNFLVLLAISVVAGCGRLRPEPPQLTYNPTAETVIPARLVGDVERWPADRLEFGDVRVEGDTLIASVTYAGGCREHGFALVFGSAFLESEPVQLRGFLSHDSQGDMCRALVGRTLHFDLSPLRDAYREAYRTESGAILLAGNWPRSVRYQF